MFDTVLDAPLDDEINHHTKQTKEKLENYIRVLHVPKNRPLVLSKCMHYDIFEMSCEMFQEIFFGEFASCWYYKGLKYLNTV